MVDAAPGRTRRPRVDRPLAGQADEPAEFEASPLQVVAAEGGVRRALRRTRLRALELVDAGWSWAQAGREVGVAKTIQTWIKKRSAA